MLPSLSALRVLEAAARLNSFSRAADELHVTHAAVSHQIRLLEDWFERPLFIREKRSVRLVPEAASLAQTLSVSLARIEAETHAFHIGTTRELTVACIASIATRWLIPALPNFLSANPDINVRVVYAMGEQRFREGDCDVLITLGEDRSETRECTRLFSRANRPVASPSYIARHGKPATARQIAGADLLHDETPDRWLNWCRKAGLQPDGPLRGPVFQDFNLLATAVVAGHGIALCPTAVFRRELRNGDLIILSDIETLADESYFLVAAKPASATTVKFRDWFCDLTGNDLESG
ncbi:LysR substrate-binding domain-containing protein [Pararhizobium sp. BT-229]|uniref:LysR substrate-binding domain-containing protein n=1 Tax=Pararhizobium sp. BT-229 TaxID=2986923 RepID=UPI0021F7896E|nr:LysR substrate-binding domain-containing protein [Pararhizobium sp. BT-229]MCV9967374.1 LysR substrate-binding domain-containing protein [Pararhizobium sp. BT-229]